MTLTGLSLVSVGDGMREPVTSIFSSFSGCSVGTCSRRHRRLLRVCHWDRQAHDYAGVERIHDRQRQFFPLHSLHGLPPENIDAATGNDSDSRYRKQVNITPARNSAATKRRWPEYSRSVVVAILRIAFGAQYAGHTVFLSRALRFVNMRHTRPGVLGRRPISRSCRSST